MTAITIAAGLGIYGLVGMATGNSGALITLLIAAWVIWQSKGLYECAKRNEVHTHPLFARDCLLHSQQSTRLSSAPSSSASARQSEAQPAAWQMFGGKADVGGADAVSTQERQGTTV
jgi:hypothetical protein